MSKSSNLTIFSAVTRIQTFNHLNAIQRSGTDFNIYTFKCHSQPRISTIAMSNVDVVRFLYTTYYHSWIWPVTRFIVTSPQAWKLNVSTFIFTSWCFWCITWEKYFISWKKSHHIVREIHIYRYINIIFNKYWNWRNNDSKDRWAVSAAQVIARLCCVSFFPRLCSYEKSSVGLRISQDDVLARELLLHQGGVWHQVCKDGRVDGQRGDGHPEGLRVQGLHLSRIQEREGQLSRKYLKLILL